jgi:hypothetical protein
MAICLGGPILEMFDSWDRTAQDGNDTETDAVVAALCVGVAFAIGSIVVVPHIRSLSAASGTPRTVPRIVVPPIASILLPTPTTSPPAILRV